MLSKNLVKDLIRKHFKFGRRRINHLSARAYPTFTFNFRSCINCRTLWWILSVRLLPWRLKCNAVSKLCYIRCWSLAVPCVATLNGCWVLSFQSSTDMIWFAYCYLLTTKSEGYKLDPFQYMQVFCYGAGCRVLKKDQI